MHLIRNLILTVKVVTGEIAWNSPWWWLNVVQGNEPKLGEKRKVTSQ